MHLSITSYGRQFYYKVQIVFWRAQTERANQCTFYFKRLNCNASPPPPLAYASFVFNGTFPDGIATPLFGFSLII
jgi:hypothetical protein